MVCFTQVYDQCLPTRRIRDYDNLEEKQLLDVLSTFVMADDTGLLCDAYNTAALGRDFFCFHRYRTFDGPGGSDGELIAVHGEIQPGGAAGEGVVTQHTVGIRECEGILLAVPFQLIGPGVGGAAEKAGQHGVLLYRAFDLIVVSENLTAQRMVVTVHLNDIVVALRTAPHMVKLAVALAYDCLPYEQLRGDLRGKLIFVRSPGVAVALPAILHDSTDICLDDSRRNGRIQARRVAVPKALAVGAV